MGQSFQFQYRQKLFQLSVTDDGALELYLQGCLRKRRERGSKEPQYVWTNVELEWEEHHYVEARYWASSGEVSVTVNGNVLLTQVLASAVIGS